MLGLVVAACLVNWFVATLFVEAHLFDRPRDWCINMGIRAWHPIYGWRKLPWVMPEGTTADEAAQWNKRPYRAWGKLAQLVTCHACLCVWIGFAEAMYFGGPDHHRAAVVANGLLYAAGSHLILEARSRLAVVAHADQ